ncbi:MAG: peptidyl-tRNA hydrolase [Myxococcaceae bacterium]|nr:peptidyl-tRNA hydrolase [Myxococcaceae bacterium]
MFNATNVSETRPTRLVVGLGNPGERYERTPHNLGFDVVDRLAASLGASAWQAIQQHKARAEWAVAGAAVLLKPLRLMNLSGTPVQRALKRHAIPVSELVVVHDDWDVPFGHVVVDCEGCATAGHLGVASVVGACGDGFSRVRVGVPRGDVVRRFADNEMAIREGAIELAAASVIDWLGGRSGA